MSVCVLQTGEGGEYLFQCQIGWNGWKFNGKIGGSVTEGSAVPQAL